MYWCGLIKWNYPDWVTTASEDTEPYFLHCLLHKIIAPEVCLTLRPSLNWSDERLKTTQFPQFNQCCLLTLNVSLIMAATQIGSEGGRGRNCSNTVEPYVVWPPRGHFSQVVSFMIEGLKSTRYNCKARENTSTHPNCHSTCHVFSLNAFHHHSSFFQRTWQSC